MAAMLALGACGGSSAPAQTAAAATTVATTAAIAPSPTAVPSAVATPPSGKPTREVLTVGGTQRQATVYVPTRLSADRAPAILALHGGYNTEADVRSLWGLQDQADQLGFVAVFPEGTFQPPGLLHGCCSWNDGLDKWGEQQPPDDIAFFNALLDVLVAKYPVDAKRVYFTGWNNGAAMALRIVCELSDRVEGIAVVSGYPVDVACQIERPLSVLVIHGTADLLFPYTGGTGHENRNFPAVTDLVEFWRKHDGCTTEAAVTMLTPTVEQRRYGGCQAGSEVAFVTVKDGSHCWFGAQCVYPATVDPSFKATPIVVEFLLAHRQP